jgi:hypothetical protein
MSADTILVSTWGLSMSTDQPSPTFDQQTRFHRSRYPRSRLQALLAVAALSVVLYVFVRLDRSAAEWFGPIAEAVHDLFNQVPGKAAPLTAAARRLKKDVTALGGVASVSVRKPGFFGTIGQTEWANVDFRNQEFDDAAFAQLAETHGARIGGLYLENTGVTDGGLTSLSKFIMLRHLHIRNYRQRKSDPVPSPKITDAGMVHLKGLDRLRTLNLSDLPVTDAGLAAIEGLPELMGLYLSRTKVQGRSLGRMKSLRRLSILYLDGSELTEDGLKNLSGATNLQFLSLDGVPLSVNALPYLKAIPRLSNLELTGCGFLDEEVADLTKQRPSLRIKRR